MTIVTSDTCMAPFTIQPYYLLHPGFGFEYLLTQRHAALGNRCPSGC